MDIQICMHSPVICYLHEHTCPDDSHVAEIVHYLQDLASKFLDVGVALRLPYGKLKEIEYNHSRSCRSALSEVIYEWVKLSYDTQTFGMPTWRMLVEAVADLSGFQLCVQIANEHPAYRT